MSRAALLIVVVAGTAVMPDACAKALGRSVSPDTAEAPPMPALPVTSATTPPVWTPPETGGPPSPALAAPVNPDLAKARSFAQAGDHKKVRGLLERKVKAGKASREEAALLLESCIALRDKSCVDAVKAKHPEVDSP
jgi:hypothetical protein